MPNTAESNIKVVSIFSGLPVDFNSPLASTKGEETFALETKENVSLALARREKFDLMCADLLWGTEDETAFGEMLRGIVIAFTPKNRFHLQLLYNVAHCQWMLQRVGAIQSSVFLQGAETRGRHGLPAGTFDAFTWREDTSGLLQDLQRSIDAYLRVRGPINK